MNHSDRDRTSDILPTAQLWADAMEAVIEAMVSARPKVDLRPAQSGNSDSLFWWKQSFNISPNSHLWVGSAESSWDDLGRYVLASLGIDAPELDDVRSTCRDLVAQVSSSFAAVLSQTLSKEITCTNLSSEPLRSDAGVSFTFTIDAGLISISGRLAFDAGLVANLPGPSVQRPRELPDAVVTISLPTRVVLGRASMALKDICKLNVGSIIRLDRSVDEPADVLIRGKLIARGQVVSVNSNYGIKILALSSNREGGAFS